MVRPTSGTGEVLGLSIADRCASVEIRRRAAFVDPATLYPWMTEMVLACAAPAVWNAEWVLTGGWDVVA